MEEAKPAAHTQQVLSDTMILRQEDPLFFIKRKILKMANTSDIWNTHRKMIYSADK